MPLTGGIFLLLSLIHYYLDKDKLLLFFLFLIFLVGILGDSNIVISPLKRIIIQILCVVLFVIFLEIEVNDIRVDFLNEFLSYKYFNIFFVTFCFLVLINGANFIDGNNGLAIGYFLIIFLSILNLSDKNYVQNDLELMIYFSSVLIILLIFNLFNFFYLGDSGIYLLSLFTGLILTNIFTLNSNISPYYIALLLWYPAFEILFSMVRKISQKFSPMQPDTFHFHQVVFAFLNKKLNYSKKITNSLTGVLINLFNLSTIYFFSFFLYSTKIQIFAIAFNIMFYILIYYTLNKK